MGLTPLAMAANVVNAALVCLAFWQTVPSWFLVSWSVWLLILVWRGTQAWLRARRYGPREGASAHAIRRTELHASLLAATWAIAASTLFAAGSADQRMLIASVTIGMIGGGGAVGLVLSDVSTGAYLAPLLVVYCAMVIGGMWSMARTFGAQLLAEAEAARQSEVIGLLLRDFEESASDVLWEADAEGRLCLVSPRLAEMFGLAKGTLESAPLIEALTWVAPTDADADDGRGTLGTRLRGVVPFRDVIVCGARGGDTRWWSLSAKPRHLTDGQQAGWRGVVSDVTEAYRANQQLTWLAHNDSVTGLGNRHQFRSRLAHVLASPPRVGESVAVVYVDLDHFKAINDSLGHSAGDAVLKMLGERMLALVHHGDTVARLGGDEFAMVLSSITSVDEVEGFSRRLLAAVTEPCEVGGRNHRVRCSVGVSLAPHHGRDVDTLLNHADLALYAAKAAGRNSVRIFSPAMAADTRRRIAIEEGLREAVAHGELYLLFQSMIAVSDRRVQGFEALLRWRHPVLGEVSPIEFIPIAEESGQMGHIGGWVLESACRYATTWPAHITVAVNVSPAQASSSDFASQVLATLGRSGVAPGRLVLEITESALLTHDESTVHAMRELRAAGCQMNLDDFGTGYSALSYLLRFPFNALKIDRSLVSGLEERADALAIVRMILGLAQALELQTIAEGVEALPQMEMLARLGCDSAQGYWISRPMPPEAIQGYLLVAI